jgi:hypothetical protein
LSDQPLSQTDLTMEPLGETTHWFESGPNAIHDDLALATLIIRIGMVDNALSAQFNAARAAGDGTSALGMRDVVCSLVTSAALTDEAIRVVSGGLKLLRPLALAGDATEDVVEGISQLCAGKHPAAEFLYRARNKVGFHWDEKIIKPSVESFGKKEKLVWIEAGADHDFVHRLASEVLLNALFPSATPQRSLDAMVRQEIVQVADALKLIVKFCNAAAFGYLKTCGAALRSRDNPAPTRSDAHG